MRLRLQHVTILKPNKSPLIENLDVTFDESKLINIMGPSGCGKSSLLRSCMGLSKPYKGHIIFNEQSIYSDKASLSKHRQRCFAVLQKHTFIGDSIYENLTLSEKIDNDYLLKINELWREFKMPDVPIKALANPKQFSGGELQRMAIIRCIIRNPKIALLDEPTSALDNSLSELAYNHIRNYLPNSIIISINHRFPSSMPHQLMELKK